MGRAFGWLRLEVRHVLTTGQLASHGCPHALCPKLTRLLLVPQSGDPSSSSPKEHRLWGQAARVQIPTTHIFCKTGTYPPRSIGASKGGAHKAWRPVLPTCQRHNYPSKADLPIISDPFHVVPFLILTFQDLPCLLCS